MSKFSLRYAAARLVEAGARRFGLEPPAQIPPSPRRAPQAVSAPYLDRWTQHPSYGLTPADLSAYYAQAEAGYPATQCDLFADMIERDGHLRSNLEDRVVGVAGNDWLIEAGGDAPEDARAAKLLETACRGVETFEEMIVHQLQALWYGYAGTEIDWCLDGELVVPVWFRNVPPRRFRFGDPSKIDGVDGKPRIVTSLENPYGEELAPGKWIFEAIGEAPPRGGLMRTAAWWAYFKKLTVRDWLVFSERFGLPYVSGTYDETADDESIATLKQAVQKLGKDGAAVYSKACNVVIHELQRGGKTEDVQGSLVSLCNSEMSKLVSGATLTSDSGGPGSFALGQVHEHRSIRLMRADARRVGKRFSASVGAAFVAYNGLKARPPRLRIDVTPEVDPLTRARILEILSRLGMTIDEGQARKEFNVKSPVGPALPGAASPSPAAPAPTEGEDEAEPAAHTP